MTTILYFFWTGFTGTSVVLDTSPIVFLRGGTNQAVSIEGATNNVR